MSRSGRPSATTTPKGSVLSALTVVPSPSPMTPASTSSFAMKRRDAIPRWSARRGRPRGAALKRSLERERTGPPPLRLAELGQRLLGDLPAAPHPADATGHRVVLRSQGKRSSSYSRGCLTSRGLIPQEVTFSEEPSNGYPPRSRPTTPTAFRKESIERGRGDADRPRNAGRFTIHGATSVCAGRVGGRYGVDPSARTRPRTASTRRYALISLPPSTGTNAGTSRHGAGAPNQGQRPIIRYRRLNHGSSKSASAKTSRETTNSGRKSRTTRGGIAPVRPLGRMPSGNGW